MENMEVLSKRDSDKQEEEEVGTEIRQEGSRSDDHRFQTTQAQEVTDTRKGDPHQADSTDMPSKLPRRRSGSHNVSGVKMASEFPRTT